MGFRKPDLITAQHAIQSCLAEIRSPYNDGWTASACKYDLYMLKSWLDDAYKQLPVFAGEQQWEQERIINILKKD